MSTAVVLDLPDALVAQFNQEKEHVPAILERGFRELQMARTGNAQAIDEIIAVLASQPTPEEILALHPSPQLQARVSELLASSKTASYRILKR